jgi:hypothetical protein
MIDSSKDHLDGRLRVLLLALSVLFCAWMASWNLQDALGSEEVQAVRTALSPLRVLLARCAYADPSPPFYPLLLKLWMTLVGPTELSMRLLSLGFAMLSMALLFDAAWRKRGPFVATFAALSLGLSASFLHFAVEVRPTAMFLFLNMACVYAFIRWQAKPERWTWALVLFLAESSLLWTSYYGLITVFLLNLLHYLGYHGPDRAFNRWGIIQTWTLTAYSWWLPVLLVQISDLNLLQDWARVQAAAFPRFVEALGPAAAHPVPFWRLAAGALAVGAGLVGIVRVFREVWGQLFVPRTPCPPTITRPQFLSLTVAMTLAMLLPFAQLLVPAPDSYAREALMSQFPLVQIVICGILTLGSLTAFVHLRLTRVLPLPTVAAYGLLASLMLASSVPLLGPVPMAQGVFLLPFCAYLAAIGLRPRQWLAGLPAFALLLTLAVPSLLNADQGFEARPDFRALAGRIRATAGPAQGVANFIIPMWDRVGLEYYLGAATANGVMSPIDLPPANLLPQRVNVVLTREALDRAELFQEAFAKQLAPAFTLVEASNSGSLVLLGFERLSEVERDEDPGNQLLQ